MMHMHRLSSRQRKGRLLKYSVMGGFYFVIVILVVIFGSIIAKAMPAFWRVEVYMTVPLPIEDSAGLSLVQAFDDMLTPEVLSDPQFNVHYFLSFGAHSMLQKAVKKNPNATEVSLWVPVTEQFSNVFHGVAESNDQLLLGHSVLEILQSKERISNRFNSSFFTSADSRESELAGIAGAFVGSFYCFLLTLLLGVPFGILTGIYLREFAPRSAFFDFINASINNLAAVPSIIFGLMGLTIFITLFGLPRSTPLVGGIVLALMTLPTVIIVTQSSLARVPVGLREGTIALGATHLQMVFFKALPHASSGILTGVIIGIAQALGETAPLMMVGMLVFIPYVPVAITEPSTSLPVQIYLWSFNPEAGFESKTAAAILVLLLFIFAMNGVVMWLRARGQR